MGIQTKWPMPKSRTYPSLACRTVMIVAARSPVPSTTHASTLGRKKMDDRLINGSPAIHGHQTMGILKMFLTKSTKGFMVGGCPERTLLGNFRYYSKCLAKIFQSV